MGIYEQPNSWQCGPFALKHALVARGVFVHENEITRVAGSTEALGTDELQLTRAALQFGGLMQTQRHHTAFAARRALSRLLVDHVPVLLCVDQWDHWITAVGADREHVVVFDTHYATVLRLEPWDALLRRLAFRHRVRYWPWQLKWYDLHPLHVRGETGLQLALTPERARHLIADGTLWPCLDEWAQLIQPHAVRNGRRSGAFALASWLEERAGQLEPTTPEGRLAQLAQTADLFGVRTDLSGAHAVLRSLKRPADAGRPAPEKMVAAG
jgi:hypothetical protein